MSPASASAPDGGRSGSLTGELERLDLGLLRAARGLGDVPARDRAVASFSALGQYAAIWLAIGGTASLLARRERRPSWRAATAVVAGGYVLNTAIKFVVRRRRPELADLPPLTGTPTRLSFPSAHATTSFAAATAFSRAGAPPAPLYGLATALALSRLYLGVHYPSDVAAGAMLGTALGALAPL
jgi:undecaprenyl-diphosphatase